MLHKLEQYAGSQVADILQHRLQHSVFAYVEHEKVHVMIGEKLNSAVEFQSAENTLDLVVASTGNAIPCVVVLANHFATLNIRVAKHSRVHFVFVSEGGCSFARVQNILLNEHAFAEQLWVEKSGKENAMCNRTVTLKEGAQFCEVQIFTSDAPAGNSKITLNTVLDGVKANAKSAAVIFSGGGKFEYEPIQTHTHPHTYSRLNLKMLLSGKSHAFFKGLVVIEKEAQKSQAFQENKNLILSEHASVDAMPRLEILPHDVSCKHGSATGEIDKKQLNYLMSRGFSLAEAQSVLVQSFAEGVLGDFQEESDLYKLAHLFLASLFLGM